MFTGRKVALAGIGVSNRPLITFLAAHGAHVFACDSMDGGRGAGIVGEETRRPGLVEAYPKGSFIPKGSLRIEPMFGEGWDTRFDEMDYVFRSPGMRADMAQLAAAAAKGAVITSEMELFLDICPPETYGVTGSDGKTTTTTLIRDMLMEGGYACRLGGNIGRPLLSEIYGISPEERVVLELSSFQLQTMRRSPRTAVVTNITPNHLDVHASMGEYVEAKRNVYRHQRAEDDPLLVLNRMNPYTGPFAGEAAGRCVTFAGGSEVPDGFADILERDGHICVGGEKVVAIGNLKVKGAHMVENAMAAIGAAVREVGPECVARACAGFGGVEHRLEYVGTHGGVRFVNDSASSSPTRAIAGLRSFDGKVSLIAGGYDKMLDYAPMGGPMLDRVDRLYLIGDTACKIEGALLAAMEAIRRPDGLKGRAVGDGAGDRSGSDYRLASGAHDICVTHCRTLEEAVRLSYERGGEGDTVLLSPGSASFGMFKNFEERGRRFKELVASLPP